MPLPLVDSAWIGPFRGDLVANGSVTSRIPTDGGVYLWARTLRDPGDAVYDSDSFLEWLAAECSVPIAIGSAMRMVSDTGERTLRSELLRIDKLSFGGGALTATKISSLASACENAKDRSALYVALARVMDRFGPVLYVGKTDAQQGLRQRLSQHASGMSPLFERASAMSLSLDQVSAYCMPLAHLEPESRSLIEAIFTHLLLAPLTLRPG